MKEFDYLLSQRKVFVFDGHYPKEVLFDLKGISAREAFYKYDTHGKLLPTKHPNVLGAVLKAKGSLNFHIKMWAEDRAKGYLPGILFSFKVVSLSTVKFFIDKIGIKEVRKMFDNTIEKELNLPDWVIKAVENQKVKFYK